MATFFHFFSEGQKFNNAHSFSPFPPRYLYLILAFVVTSKHAQNQLKYL